MLLIKLKRTYNTPAPYKQRSMQQPAHCYRVRAHNTPIQSCRRAGTDDDGDDDVLAVEDVCSGGMGVAGGISTVRMVA